MVIYFTGSLTAQEELKQNYNDIHSVLVEIGNEIITDLPVVQAKKTKYSKKPGFYFEQVLQNITRSNMMVIEISNPGNTLANEITFALEQGKPVLGLYDVNFFKEIKPLLVGNTSDILLVKEYTDKTIKEVVKTGLKEVKKHIKEKFTFTLSDDLIEYLDWASKNRRMSRSAYIRAMLEETSKKDPQYRNQKKYL